MSPGRSDLRRGRVAALLRHWPLRADTSRLLLAALALVLAWVDPRVTLQRPRPALVVTVDITQSMNVPDLPDPDQPGTLQPRLALTRRLLHQALARLPCGSQVGWAVFTEYRSYLLLAPLEVCAHLGELRATLAGIDNRMAWTGNSEVAKGLHSAWDTVGKLPGQPALVFITDGQEAPPLSPKHRPRFDDPAGGRAGLLVGAGGLKPQPIPHTDPNGRPLGDWAADEVLQHDPRSRGRGASVGGEQMADDAGPAAVDAAALGATPGSEHLSALREGYLQRLAGERGLAYHRLADTAALLAALQAPALSRPVAVPVPLAPLALGLALGLLAWPYRPIRTRPPRP